MSSGGQTISVNDLDVAQLAEIRKQFEDELDHLTNSFAQLKQAQAKFKACIENVKEVTSVNADKIILVPLTNSLYVPGKLSDPNRVIVDVGTGYYVEKTRTQATKHYADKVEYIRTNLDALEETISDKRETMGQLNNMLQAKLQAQVQEQQTLQKKE